MIERVGYAKQVDKFGETYFQLNMSDNNDFIDFIINKSTIAINKEPESVYLCKSYYTELLRAGSLYVINWNGINRFLKPSKRFPELFTFVTCRGRKNVNIF